MSTAEEGPLASLPGYFWDKEKGRYFKIEKHGPPEASWTADNVKRRKKEQRAASEKARLEEKRAKRKPVRRASIFLDPLLGGLLRRELGAQDTADVGVTAFTRNLQDKGSIPTPRVWERPNGSTYVLLDSTSIGPRVNNFWVGGSDLATGLGVAHLCLSNHSVESYYLPRDKKDRILGNSEQFYRLRHGNNGRPGPVGAFDGFLASQLLPRTVSSIKYHEPSRTFLLSTRDASGQELDCGLHMIRHCHNDPQGPDRPLWDLSCISWEDSARMTPRSIFTSAPAPALSPLRAVLGTQGGFVELPLENLSRATLRRPKLDMQAQDSKKLQILALDFQAKHHNIVLAGGSAKQVWLVDLRDRNEMWPQVRTGTPVTHVKSINEHHFLAAGIRNHLAVYDTRFPFKNGTQAAHRHPVYEFHGYRNEAHLMEIGLDVDVGLGMVAAAHDDYKVAIYSLKTGLRLPSPIVDAIFETSVAPVLQFATLPGDKNPSLFVAQGSEVRKYSFASDGDEWGE